MCAKQMPGNSHSKFGLILLGNTGVGKSFIGNVVLGRDVFEHECSASSVTHETEFEDYAVGNGSFAVFNIPGLVEAEQEAIDRNKIEIYKAFQQRPNSVVAFVFNGGAGGRILDEDVVAFKAINDVYHFDSESLLLIINDLPHNRPAKYEGGTAMKLERLIEISNVRMCFLDRINDKTLSNNERIRSTNSNETSDSSAKAHGIDSKLNEREKMRRKLMDAIMSCTPRIHEKHGDIQLNVDKMKILMEESKKIQRHFEEEREKLQTDIDRRQKEFDEYKRQQEALPREVHHYHEKIIEREASNGRLGGILGIIPAVANLFSRFF